MSLSPEDRERIVEAMARALCDATLWPNAWLKANDVEAAAMRYNATAALDAALSAGLADAIRRKALEDGK